MPRMVLFEELVKTGKVTLIEIVLDASGSMQMVLNDTIGGFNSFLADQKKLVTDQPTFLSLTLFSSNMSREVKLETLYEFQDIKKVEKLTDKLYRPSGGTPLLDAVGTRIEAIDRITGKNKPNVLFVILTDGEENTSISFSAPKIKEMTDAREGTNWTFVYLGAYQEAWEIGSKYGYRNTLNIDTDMSTGMAATGESLKRLSNATAMYRNLGSVYRTDFFNNNPKKGE